MSAAMAVRRSVAAAVLILLTAGLSSLSAESSAAPVIAPGVSSISAAGSTTCAIESGKAYCWGSNVAGELGDGGTNESDVPVAVDTSGVLAGKTLIQIAAGDDHTCALDSAGAAYCWGSNMYGQLGDGTTTPSSIPVAVDTSALAGRRLIRITAGTYVTCALDSQGAAYCWGLGGELGDGSNANSSVPTAVDTSGTLSGKTLTQITTGAGFTTCALDSAGAAYCWGYNAQGELGDGTTTPSSVPVAVDTSGVLAGKTLTQITAGQLHVCALDAVGAAYCWGYDDYGEIGDGYASGNPSSVPVAVITNGALAGKVLVRINAGWDHTCALDSMGAAYCWGENGPGELGDGTTTDSRVPVAVDTSGVLADKTLTDIAAGGYHTCAVDSSGAAYCWGYDYSGELGDDHEGTRNDSDVPVLTGPQAPSGLNWSGLSGCGY